MLERITVKIESSMSPQSCAEPRYAAWMTGYPEMVGPNRVGPELRAERNRETEQQEVWRPRNGAGIGG